MTMFLPKCWKMETENEIPVVNVEGGEENGGVDGAASENIGKIVTTPWKTIPSKLIFYLGDSMDDGQGIMESNEGKQHSLFSFTYLALILLIGLGPEANPEDDAHIEEASDGNNNDPHTSNGVATGPQEAGGEGAVTFSERNTSVSSSRQ